MALPLRDFRSAIAEIARNRIRINRAPIPDTGLDLGLDIAAEGFEKTHWPRQHRTLDLDLNLDLTLAGLARCAPPAPCLTRARLTAAAYPAEGRVILPHITLTCHLDMAP
jgi:hypothetical protein